MCNLSTMLEPPEDKEAEARENWIDNKWYELYRNENDLFVKVFAEMETERQCSLLEHLLDQKENLPEQTQNFLTKLAEEAAEILFDRPEEF